MLRHPLLNLLCLVWTVVWMGVLAPGHERGVLRLPGPSACSVTTEPAAPGAGDTRPTHACCIRPAANNTDEHEPPTGDQSEDKPAGRCAVCQLLATLDAPAAIDLSVAPPELLRWLPLLSPAADAPVQPVLAHGARDPPGRSFA